MVLSLLLAGCVSPQARVEALADAGWLGEACATARFVDEPPRALLDAHLQGTREVWLAVVPASEFPRAPAYGERAVVAQVALHASDSAALQHGVWIAARDEDATVRSCPTCGEATFAEWLGLPPPAKGRRWGLFGVFALPFTLAFDIAMAPARVLAAMGGGTSVPWATEGVLRRMAAGAPSGLVTPGFCTADAPCGETWVGGPGEGEALEPGTIEVTWRFLHADCEVDATWRRPLPAGDGLLDRLTKLGAAPLALDGEPDAWSVRAR